MYAFTKPSTTRSMRKNKQKASRRVRENEYWDAWKQNWLSRRDCLQCTFRLWSDKDHLTLKEKYSNALWRPTRWVDITRNKKRAELSAWMKRELLHELKTLLRCLSIKDIALKFSNELDNRLDEEATQKRQRQQKQEQEEENYLHYLEWEEPSPRRRKK